MTKRQTLTHKKNKTPDKSILTSTCENNTKKMYKRTLTIFIHGFIISHIPAIHILTKQLKINTDESIAVMEAHFYIVEKYKINGNSCFPDQ